MGESRTGRREIIQLLELIWSSIITGMNKGHSDCEIKKKNWPITANCNLNAMDCELKDQFEGISAI